MNKLPALCTAVLAATTSQWSCAEDLTESPFFKDSKTQLLSRNFYFNRDYHQANAPQNYREEWAQGFIGTFNSGFTSGTLGFGLDLIGMYGMKLDSSSDRINTGLLPSSGNRQAGVDHAQDDYSKAGGAIKIKVSQTVLKYGDQILNTPVFTNSDSRLLPETARGFYLNSQEIANLTIEAGHITSMTLKERTSHDSSPLTKADFLGATYKFTPSLSASLYGSHVEDYWDKTYVGASWTLPVNTGQTLTFDFRGYDLKSSGQQRGGELDNRAFSLKATYLYGPHTFAVANQQVHGKGAYSYGVDGGDSNYLANYIQFGDFVREDEVSWQARYDYNFASLGIPGLAFMVRYVHGDNITLPSGVTDATEWERNVQLAYVVQSGPAKKLSFKIRHATYRNDFGTSLDEVRLITEYPLNW